MVTIKDIRHEMHYYNENVLSNEKIKHFIDDIEDDIGTTITDDRAKRYLTCYRIAVSLMWNRVVRIDDVSFGEEKSAHFKKLYIARCSKLNLTPVGLDDAKIKMRKINYSNVDTTEKKIV